MSQEEIVKYLSRRKMLRDSAMAATGAVLLPSFLTGCNKDVQDIIKYHFPKKGLGAVALTPDELKAAADNLNRMRALLKRLYDFAFKYDEVVFLALASTKTRPSWTNFIANIFIDIAAAAAVATAIITVNPLAVPAIACLSAFLHDWGIGKNTPPEMAGLNGFFAAYQDGHLKMQDALDRHLGFLTDVTGNYANLREAWKDPIVFNGGTFSLADLAKSFFPDEDDHDVEFRKIYDPMYLHHQKSVWNLAVMKCCTLYQNWDFEKGLQKRSGELMYYARNEFYPQYTGVYLRGSGPYPGIDTNVYRLRYWNLGINGNAFSEEASQILFKDDTPDHIINPEGLFNRDYVFKQFHTKKPDLSGGQDLSNSLDHDFSRNNDWEFTGGFFPGLTTK